MTREERLIRYCLIFVTVYEQNIADDVRNYGYSVVNIFDGEPRFIYTVGLMLTCKHPEMIVFGMDAAKAAALVKELANRIYFDKLSFAESGTFTASVNGEEQGVGFRPVHPTQHPLYFGYAMGFCREARLGELQAVEVFWPDEKGKFPFDVGCDEDVYRQQPRLDIALTPREVRGFERLWE